MSKLRSDLFGSIFSSGSALSKTEGPRVSMKSELNKNNMSSLYPVVIYITGEDDDKKELQSCEIIESICRRDLNIMSQRKVASPDFLSDLQSVGFVSRPRVFFRGRYVGGLKEVVSLLLDPAQLEALATSCCAGHKFTLLSTHNLIPCTPCQR